MATVNYLYRSVRETAFLDLRLLYAYEGKDYLIGGKTQLKVSKTYWNVEHPKARNSDIEVRNYKTIVTNHLNDLTNHILKSFDEVENPTTLNKDWLTDLINEYYNPSDEQPQAPKELIPFFDFYLTTRNNLLTENRKKKLRVTKRKIKRFEKATNQKLLISDINDVFLNSFLSYGLNEKYSTSTLKGDLAIVKTICRYAKQYNIEVSPQLHTLQIKNERTPMPYLNFDELKKIKEVNLTGYLDNARNWLIISCYTGQRISDFMRFNSDMIRVKDGKKVLEFKQQKTQKRIAIPFLEQAEKIYIENGNSFPRPISSQKYNKYIKEVCRLAGIKSLTTGKVEICIAGDPNEATKNDYRRGVKEVPKHKLITSHVGRRSFASNYYGKVPTPYLIMVTGHSSEKEFLNYIQKNSDDMAMDAFKYFGQ